MPSEPTTEAGKALLWSDFDTTGWGPRIVRDHVSDAIILSPGTPSTWTACAI